MFVRFSCALVLLATLAAAAAAQGAKPKPTNRLAKESSLYLRMHGHNPVDWYPWGEEALAKAKKENKLIFLSIGYSSCHWCHVMERESFLDEEIAALLNKRFVCIKVDREERPEIDSIYMTSLQVYMKLAGGGGGGGWPLSMFLTPDGEPFFGGTYFPARDGDRERATGFLTIVSKVDEVWEKSPEKIEQDAGTLTKFVREQLERTSAGVPLKLEALDNVHEALWQQFDSKYGGFGFNPDNPATSKFPEPTNFVYLLDRIRRLAGSAEQQAQARTMLTTTLDKIAEGGIYDHVGGGFHRYAVDRRWTIPHFEKMLYDNGQLASVYAEAYGLTKHENYARVARETLDFVLREMTDKQGGFFTALDAESEHEEGKFYRWTKEELAAALTKEEFAFAAPIYLFDRHPNFDEKFYCLQIDESWEALAAARKTTVAKLQERLTPIKTKLLEVRNKRVRPLTDDKILTATNGLMIRGFADAGRILKESKYVAAAEKSATFVLERLRDKDGRLLRSYAGGEAKLNAYLEDYAFFVNGLLALHQATGDQRWLDEAAKLTDLQIKLFADEKQGGFYFTSGDHEKLIARSKDFNDGVQPSGNTVALANLLTLAEKTKKPAYREQAKRTLDAASLLLMRSPLMVPQLAVGAAKLVKE
jgi:uncharacterized protein YyaL (SSP411 family)